MNHLTETQLNEYLDSLMDAPAQTALQVHIAGCAECRERLAALQAVFQALSTLPEETPMQDLTPSILQALPNGSARLGWRLAFAFQAGLSLGLLILLSPFMAGRMAAILPVWNSRFALPEVKLPNPAGFHFSLPVVAVPHPSFPALPVTITHAYSSIWLVLGIAAFLLFVVGNFSLIFHNPSNSQTRK
jgi:hypothetical protein